MSTVTKKEFTIGRDLRACKITPLIPSIVSSVVVYTLGVPATGKYSMKGYVNSIALRVSSVNDEIMDINSSQANNVDLYNNYSLVITEQKRRRTAAATTNGSADDPKGSLLPWFCSNYKYALIEFTECSVNGAASTGETYACYGMWSDFDDGSRGQGGQQATMTFIPAVFYDNSGVELSIVALDTTTLGAPS